MNADAGNLFAGVPANAGEETFDDLLTLPGLKIERIVSTGQSSPPGFWYDQGWTEWVLLLSGAAAVQFEGEDESRARSRQLSAHSPEPPPSRGLDQPG